MAKKGGKQKAKQSLKKGGPASSSRQATNCSVADVVATIRRFTLYTTNLNQNKRIRGFVALGAQKRAKAGTVFDTAAAMMMDATSKGTVCGADKPPNATVLAVYNKLQNCSATAATLCTVSLTAAQNATVTSCATALSSYITAFQVKRGSQVVRGLSPVFTV